MNLSYRIGFGFFGKLAVVAALGATLAGGIAMAHAQPQAVDGDRAPVDVVRLEPVSVTISSERFASIRADLRR